jgi:hypothetical protein
VSPTVGLRSSGLRKVRPLAGYYGPVLDSVRAPLGADLGSCVLIGASLSDIEAGAYAAGVAASGYTNRAWTVNAFTARPTSSSRR